MSSMLDAPPTGSRRAPVAAAVGTLLAHGAVALLASIAGAMGMVDVQQLMRVTQADMVEVDLPAPVPLPVAVPEPFAVKPSARAAPQPPKESPPPTSAAQAGEVLDAKSEEVDFGDRFVTGHGDRYAGGTTDPSGTSQAAVIDGSARGNAGGVAAAPSAAPPIDLSRRPKLVGNGLWQCPFPSEADDAEINHAVVTLRFEIGADGSVKSVRNTTDPGSGFAREARRCAARARWQPALDRTGRAISGIEIVNVRFDR